MLENNFASWMRQPGIVKKLQLYLALSIVLNLVLGQEIISSRLKKPKPVEEQALEANATELLTEEQLQNFIAKYLQSFFSIKDESIDFLANQTEKELFVLQLKPEILKRKELKLDSHFELDDIYIDSLDSKHAKAVVLGREVFNGDYLDRNLTMELVVDTTKLEVKAIPVFKVQ